VATLQSNAVSVDLPTGWEARITDRPVSLSPLDETGTATKVSVVHIANFALPATMGDFGSGAVELMRSTDLLVVLFEYGQESVGAPLFASLGIPQLDPGDFARDSLRRLIEGQAGVQRFFTASGRPFCLYVVLGSSTRKVRTVPVINDLLRRITVG
jgi:hypothetical protein